MSKRGAMIPCNYGSNGPTHLPLTFLGAPRWGRANPWTRTYMKAEAGPEPLVEERDRTPAPRESHGPLPGGDPWGHVPETSLASSAANRKCVTSQPKDLEPYHGALGESPQAPENSTVIFFTPRGPEKQLPCSSHSHHEIKKYPQ